MDESQTFRRQTSEPSGALLERAVKMSAPDPSYESAASEHAEQITGLTMADNPIGKKAA